MLFSTIFYYIEYRLLVIEHFDNKVQLFKMCRPAGLHFKITSHFSYLAPQLMKEISVVSSPIHYTTK